MKDRCATPLAVVLFLAWTLAACGVPTDNAPVSVADDDLPASLRPDVTTTAPSTAGGAQEAVSIYLIRGDGLVAVTDSVRAPADLRTVLALLQRGPTDAQAEEGNRSAFTGVDLIRDVDVARAMASIDLDPAFSDIPHADQILALAQLVLTTTVRPGIATVRLTVAGEPTQVPTSDGSLTTAPLSRRDYEPLVAG